MFNVITYACPNINGSLVEVRALKSTYTLLFNMDVISYPCPKPNVDLVYLC